MSDKLTHGDALALAAHSIVKFSDATKRIEQLEAELKQLKDLINADVEYSPGCDSVAHEDDCKRIDPMAAWKKLEAERDALQSKVEVLRQGDHDDCYDRELVDQADEDYEARIKQLEAERDEWKELLRRVAMRSWWHPQPIEPDGKRHYCWCAHAPEDLQNGEHDLRCSQARAKWESAEGWV